MIKSEVGYFVTCHKTDIPAYTHANLQRHLQASLSPLLSNNIPTISAPWYSILSIGSAFTCKARRSEVSSVYNNCRTTEVPFAFRLHCYCCCKHRLTSWPGGWVSSNTAASPGRPEGSASCSTYHLLLCFTIVHLKALTPGSRPVKPQSFTGGYLWSCWVKAIH